MKSIRHRIYLTIICGVVAINLLTIVFSYLHTQEELEELFDAEQAQLARLLESLITKHFSLDHDTRYTTNVPVLDEIDKQLALGHRYEKKLAFQVWDSEGNLRMMSKNAPLYPLTAKTPGYSVINYQGTRWHIFTLYVARSDIWIHTAQRADVRQELIDYLVLAQVWPVVLISLVIAALVVLLVRSGLKPLQNLSDALSECDVNQLDPLPDTRINELQPIQQSLNLLIRQVRDSILREKSFSADAAHELRTPLAAMRVHAQNLELDSDLSEQNKNSLKKIILSIDRMAHTVEQLLQLNKLENQQAYLLNESVDLQQIAIEVIAGLPPNVISGYQFELKSEPLKIVGNSGLIAVLLRNLVENAYKYSPENSNIDIQVYQHKQEVVLDVSDSGAGLTEQQKQDVTKRFYRVTGSVQFGAGLGLSIVNRIVNLHKAELLFLDNPVHQGLLVRVIFIHTDNLLLA